MKLEDQVCTFKQSQKLFDLGVSDNTHFQFCEKVGTDRYIRIRPYIDTADYKIIYPAFSAAELGIMLGGVKYEAYGHAMMFTSYCETGEDEFGWRVVYRNPKNFENPKESYPTEAQARAAMLIYLLENKITTAAEVNESLK